MQESAVIFLAALSPLDFLHETNCLYWILAYENENSFVPLCFNIIIEIRKFYFISANFFDINNVIITWQLIEMFLDVCTWYSLLYTLDSKVKKPH